jgi:Ca-activated chloride channel family protein
MISFEYYIALFLLIPAIILSINLKNIQQKNIIFHKDTINNSTNKINFKLLLLALIMMIIALAKPIIKDTKINTTILSSNIILALDLSASMKADDIYPSRLEVAKDIIKQIAILNTTDNLALFGFTTNVLPLSPMSMDHSLIVNTLDILNIDYILTKSTSIQYLQEKIKSLNYNNPMIFILSDGGDELLNLDNLNIYPILLATSKGAKLPMQNQFVISQLNTTFTNANDIVYKNTKQCVDDILNIIKNHTKKINQNIVVNENQELFIYFLIFAFVLFVIAVLDIKAKIVWILLFFGVQIQAGILDFYYIKTQNYCKIDNFQGQYNCAVMLYKKTDYTKALNIFEKLTTNEINVKSNLYYNIANCYFMKKDYNKAVINYQKSLQLIYTKDAKFNLSKALFKHNQIPQQSKNKKQNNDKNFKSKSTQQNSKILNLKKVKLTTKEENKYILGSKSYNMINKGYIDEKQPW